MYDLDKLIKELEAGAREIEQERAKADALFISIGDGAIATDEQGRINRANDIALSLLGYRAEEIIGAWYPKTILAVDEAGKPISQIDRPITKAFLAGQPVSQRCYYKKKDGTILPVAVTVSPVLLENKPVGAIEVFRDIAKEVEVDRMKSEFISLASHQLRTPLSAIMMYSHMLVDGYGGQLSPEQRKFTDTIITTVSRMTQLVNTLLNISRIESGRLQITPAKADIPQLYQEIIHELTPKLQKKGQQLIFEPTSLPQIVTDPLLVKEVLANLLSNAIKYTPEKGQIKVTVTAEGDKIVTAISDNGYGIPAAEQGRMFSKFYRGANIVQKVEEGTGLGMYLVKSIVEALAGTIWFKSVENEGTTFWFALPLTAELTAKDGKALED
ncbi:MAG TPA: PAS domain-containing sensor histidine kinase [Candidatus Dormibacteraeota bacterium]|nr:PAS domain-containing sensor histidine kinase [Candidatus Dormibacteraeota bacterium]